MKFNLWIQDGLLGPEYVEVHVRNRVEFRIRQLQVFPIYLGASYKGYVRDLYKYAPHVMDTLFADSNEALSFIKNHRKRLRV